ncbi:DUF6318 family protein [Nocardioides nematodiphilus]|uniref:DUF6318 family protein n=1 Tax=Nocardioides nematodiphilus TaxID=2849669 RepID=UPI001CDA3979|nr:DUF6318 family protein [Nocardioides nematodiphilus]MCA1982170.1 DUF6318 family protein [Nocardioides nematodiphilus]
MGKLAPALTALGLAAALSACGSEAAPAPAPTPSVAASPTPSPTPTASPTLAPPVMPEAANAHTEAGAVAFTRYVVDLVNYSFRTLDPRPLERLATKYCKNCRGGTDGVKEIAAQRGAVSGGLWTVKSLQPSRLNVPGDPIAVTFTFDAAPEMVTYPGGKTDRYTGGAARDRLVLTPTSSGWQIADWTVLP